MTDLRAVHTDDHVIYVAVDPGLITGVAFYVPGPQEWSRRFSSIEVPGGDLGFADFFRSLVQRYSVVHVVAEAFIITPGTLQKTRQYDALYILGWLKLETPRLGIPYSTQTPAAAKGFGTDRKLEHLSWRDRSVGGHQDDAARHLLTYLAQIREPDVISRLSEMVS